MTNDEEQGTLDPDALVSRLSLIEERPLSERADAYARLHDELSTVLEGSDHEGTGR
ncbi:hypothetical protein [Microbacterium sp. MPKO10]|uniref:hypothetical protein n=1 Tax=Microbacterium sp. MPKO10 TaxID=2989818 RepID=UPI0022369C44|nr:hypothetical protein [Microbacterium sp. MPKO10]MCW4459776.1 hypothetical protein [Microbacterium sp. MPKO10]